MFDAYLAPRGPVAPSIRWGMWITERPSAADALVPLLSCAARTGGGVWDQNVAGFCDRELDAAMEHAQALASEDQPAAARAWQRVDRAAARAAPLVPLSNPVWETILTSERLQDFQYHPGLGVLVSQVWLS
jgi:peptide/nickel transport system substrate-binding protein